MTPEQHHVITGNMMTSTVPLQLFSSQENNTNLCNKVTRLIRLSALLTYFNCIKFCSGCPNSLPPDWITRNESVSWCLYSITLRTIASWNRSHPRCPLVFLYLHKSSLPIGRWSLRRAVIGRWFLLELNLAQVALHELSWIKLNFLRAWTNGRALIWSRDLQE